MKRYFTQNMMNKPITMMGYSSSVLFLLFLVVVVLSLGLYNVGILFMTIVDASAIVVIIRYGKKLNKERLKGNPSYLDGVKNYGVYPKKMVDRNRILVGIIKSHRING